MSSALAFLTGLGTGYITSKDKEAKQAREDEDRAMRKDEHTARMDELKRVKNDRQALVDANAPIAMTQGAGGMLKPETMDNRDVGLPENAALPNEGLRHGSYSVAGKSFADEAAAQAEVVAQNAPEARTARTIQALQSSGNYQGAQSFQSGAMDLKTKKLGLDAAQLDFAQKKFNTELSERLGSSSDWSTTAAEILSETQVGGLSGVKVTAAPSADGKKIDFMGAMPDGTSKLLQSLDNSPTGRAQFLQAAMKADPATKINWMIEQAKTKQAQDNADRDFDLRKKDGENTQEWRARTLGIQASQEKRAAETHAVTMQDAKVPAGVKMQATLFAEQIKAVNATISTAMANNSFEPTSANAKSLLESQSDLGIQYEKLMSSYTPQGKGAPSGLPSADSFAKTQPAAKAESAPAPPKSAAQTMPMPAAAPQATTAPAAPRPASRPAALSTIDQIQADSVTALMPLAAQVKQAEATYIAAARSGDPTATARYAAEKQALSAQLNEAVNAKFGNAAPKVLQQLLAQ